MNQWDQNGILYTDMDIDPHADSQCNGRTRAKRDGVI